MKAQDKNINTLAKKPKKYRCFDPDNSNHSDLYSWSHFEGFLLKICFAKGVHVGGFPEDL